MILRRVIEHVRAQNWTAVALDFVIVVMGVFIGIQVANWNAARKDRLDEAATLGRLHIEAVSVESLSSRMLSDRIKTLKTLSNAVHKAASGAIDEIPEGSCLAIASSHDLYVGNANLPSFDELQNSGRLDIIRDRSLLRALGNLAQARASLEFSLNNFNGHMINLPHAYPDIIILFPGKKPMEGAQGDFEEDYGARCDLAGLAANPAAMNDLISNLEYFDAFERDGLNPWVGRLAEVHERLDAALSIRHGDAP